MCCPEDCLVVPLPKEMVLKRTRNDWWEGTLSRLVWRHHVACFGSKGSDVRPWSGDLMFPNGGEANSCVQWRWFWREPVGRVELWFGEWQLASDLAYDKAMIGGVSMIFFQLAVLAVEVSSRYSFKTVSFYLGTDGEYLRESDWINHAF